MTFKSQSDLGTDIDSNIDSNGTKGITASELNSLLKDVKDSFFQSPIRDGSSDASGADLTLGVNFSTDNNTSRDLPSSADVGSIVIMAPFQTSSNGSVQINAPAGEHINYSSLSGYDSSGAQINLETTGFNDVGIFIKVTSTKWLAFKATLATLVLAS